MSDTGDQGQGWGPPPPPGAPVPPAAPPGWQPPPPGGTPPPPGGTPPPPGSIPAPAYATPPPAPAPGYPPVPSGYQPQPGYGYGTPYQQGPRSEPLAIAALVCGIVAIPFCGLGIVLGILGLVFGIIAIRKIDRSQGALTGRGLALAGAICGGVGLAINVLYWGAVIVAAIADSSN